MQFETEGRKETSEFAGASILESDRSKPNDSQSSARLSRRVSVKNRHSSVDNRKTKLLKTIERKLVNVSTAEFLRKRDVTLEEKKTIKIYSALNISTFIFQVLAIALVTTIKGFDISFWTPTDTPVSVSKYIFRSEVGLIIALEILFVVLPLPCIRCFGARQHFQNILVLKVKWFFAVQCLFQACAILSYTLSENQMFNKLPVNFFAFLLLKSKCLRDQPLLVYVHYFGYRKVKYLDDGRDYVSFMEFLAIHVTFSVLSSWMTYFVTYNLFSLIKIVDEITDVNLALETVSIIAMVIQMFESTVFLAYYKDVIFASVTLLNYIGMYMHNYEGKKDLNTLNDVVHC
jgi:hypothetical protein